MFLAPFESDTGTIAEVFAHAEVDAYRKRHAIGSKARLALELVLNVGARISDAARIGRQHETNGWLKFVA